MSGCMRVTGRGGGACGKGAHLRTKVQQLQHHSLQQSTPAAVAAPLSYHLHFINHHHANVIAPALCNGVGDQRRCFLVPERTGVTCDT